MRRTLVIIVAGILIALILILLLIFGGGQKTPQQTPSLNGSTGTRPLDTSPSDSAYSGYSAGGAAPAQTPYRYYYPSTPTQETIATNAPSPSSGSSGTPPRAEIFTFSTYVGPSLREVLNSFVGPLTQATATPPRTFDGVTTPPAADMWPSQGDGIMRGGGNPYGGGRPDYEFNPMTGDGRIGDYNFSLAAGTIVNGNTSNNIGDPDNLVFGTAIGTIIGSIVGMPDLGLTLGTGIGSNLFPGYRLSNFGISVQNGIPTFDGIQPGVLGNAGSGALGAGAGSIGGGSCAAGAAGGAAGGAVGGSTGSSVGGAAGGGGYQGGVMVISIPCTCSAEAEFWWTVVSPTQYAGTYLYNPITSKLYENYVFAGTFNTVGSHTQQQIGCWMDAGPDCVRVPMVCGELNGSPGTGTSVGL